MMVMQLLEVFFSKTTIQKSKNMCLATSGYALDCIFTIGGASKLYLANLSQIVDWTIDTDGAITDVTMQSYTVTNITAASSAVFTAAGHTFEVGDLFFLTGTTTMEDADGLALDERQYTVTAVTANTFTVGDLDTSGSAAFGASSLTAERRFFEIQFAQGNASGSGNLTVSNGNHFFPQSVNFKIGSAGLDEARLVEELALGYVVVVLKTNDGLLKVFGKENGLQATQANYTSGAVFEDFAGFDVILSGAETASYRIYDPTTNPLPVFSVS